MKARLIIIIALLALMTGTVFAGGSDSTTVTAVGQTVPEFSYMTDTGKQLSIRDMQGRVVLINFFATWCPPCKKEMPELEKIWQELKDKEFYLLSIGREETMKTVRDFKKEWKLSFPMAPDPQRKIYSKFATQTIPRNVLLDEDGTIIYQSEGYTEAEFMHMLALIKEKL